jgi:hypothetical protein
MRNLYKLVKVLAFIAAFIVFTFIIGMVKYQYDVAEYRDKINCSAAGGAFKLNEQTGEKKCVVSTGELQWKK